MSSALAIASVTAVLKNLLDNALVQQSDTTNMGDIIITALPPDRISTGAEERTQLNLHLYRLTPNSSWRRTSDSTEQKEQHDTLPLALDLHYLLTAYGERDFQAEVLLGHAIQCLYESPTLTREAIRSALASASSGNGSNTSHTALPASALTEQLEHIKISPEFLSMDEMSKLWSYLQTRARLSATYQVSLILIENRLASMTALASVS
ncbi:MAG: DUF4255 domain-containing protein [Ktedonobacteraceae bacterium]